MHKVDLAEIIRRYNLDKKEIALELFPGNKYPVLAMNRVLHFEANLDSDQLSKLASLLGLSVSDLYTQQFKIGNGNQENTMVIESGEYKALLNTEKWTSRLFYKSSLFHETVLHNRSISMSSYLRDLQKIINDHKKTIHNSNLLTKINKNKDNEQTS